MERIQKQMAFLFEIDKVKDIFRQSLVVNGKREENDAEHSWHMALVALTIKEYFKGEVDLEKTLKMILIHDLVEIYAGDTPAFGEVRPDKKDEEIKAAVKLFSLLPEDQKEEFLNLWLEFEECESNEAKFANVCDRYQGFMQNLTSDGHTWKKFNAPMEKVLKRAEVIKNYVPELYEKVMLPEFLKYQERGIIK
ncbi:MULTISPECIES: HD domain-containing protein [Cetobacterium]|jgi:putative hydrolase of HD superfamily|uniref:5'-deoxynucleotidase n=1 Tax=Candidatus Cetobacterium colombiensis TaxID=3073100 RepID=A0ABU4WBB5_9FUSO|nr:HD domain-containing protein [Candidatus Cetobacterium colombiensis]MDX8336837.1 HD domain-containing protein [Candidatus Cetobacterium colombiensis]